MRVKQVVILLLAFVFPISIFIFLKVLGKNEFDVEPLYQTGSIPMQVACGTEVRVVPYTISPDVLSDNAWSAGDSVTLYILNTGEVDLPGLEMRLSKDYASHEVKKWLIVTDSAAVVGDTSGLPYLVKDHNEKSNLETCAFLMEKGKNAVLIDNKRRIRGYYQVKDRKEVDRLIVEVSIILKKY